MPLWGDSKKDSRKESSSKRESSSRKDSSSSHKESSSSRRRAEEVAASSKHRSEKSRGIPIPSRKGKELESDEEPDDYIGSQPRSQGLESIGSRVNENVQSRPLKEGSSSYKEPSYSKRRTEDVAPPSKHKGERSRGVPISSRKGKEPAEGYDPEFGSQPRAGGFESLGDKFDDNIQSSIPEGEEDIDLTGSSDPRLLPIDESGIGTLGNTYDSAFPDQQYRFSNQPASDVLSSRLDAFNINEPYGKEGADELAESDIVERPTVPRRNTQNRGPPKHKEKASAKNPVERLKGDAITEASRQGRYQNKHKNKLGKKDIKVHKSASFVRGRVIKLWWFEPRGSHMQNNASVEQGGSPSLYDQAAPGKLRRFVIIDTRRGHSICVPISTYQNQGTTKPGCHSDDHSMIYTLPWRGHREEVNGRQPWPPYVTEWTNHNGIVEPRYENLRHARIKMDTYDGGELLEPASRINYAKKYTIEHNYMVKFIGEIASGSSEDFWATLNHINYSPPPLPRAAATAGSSSMTMQNWQQQSQQQQQQSMSAPRQMPPLQNFEQVSYLSQPIVVARWTTQPPIVSQGLQHNDPSSSNPEPSYEGGTMQPASSSAMHRTPQYYQHPNQDPYGGSFDDPFPGQYGSP